jgi:hypothetical protein
MMLSLLSSIPRCSAVVLRRTIVEQPSGDGKTYDSNGLPNGASLTRAAILECIIYYPWLHLQQISSKALFQVVMAIQPAHPLH